MTIDRTNYPGVPADFPIAEKHSALSGAKPKLGLIEEGGKFFTPGTSPAEVATAYAICDDLVQQIVPYCERKLSKFNGDKDATAKAVFQGLLNKGWGTPEQNAWIMRKVVEKLGWLISRGVLPD